ncbi:response regulator transcription factor [Flaviaesturariibacter amylovorans]|uniref:Response regulator transcription factor n=1 Tax=Flaviaesturariibacter amylovorans TaxID=1084520 RepID=A0ABP8GH37_9BACT
MNNPKILIVEDEQKIADALRQGLAEHGYDVQVAYDGRLALKLFSADAFDLLIVDINLPGLSGYELCTQVRAGGSDVPVIMLTALRSLNDKIEGYDAGADDYLTKPFEFRELLMKVRVLLKRSAGQQRDTGHILRAGELEVNLHSKEVKREGRAINLTAKEFQLLEYLLRNKNRVVSRADIALNVWDIDFDTNTNVIDVYINYLRNKVDKPFADRLIHTQVGMGYILKETA